MCYDSFFLNFPHRAPPTAPLGGEKPKTPQFHGAYDQNEPKFPNLRNFRVGKGAHAPILASRSPGMGKKSRKIQIIPEKIPSAGSLILGRKSRD